MKRLLADPVADEGDHDPETAVEEADISPADVRETVMKLGHRMLLDLRAPIFKAAHDAGEYEPEVVNSCIRLAPKDGVFLDIGANIGLYTCPLAAHFRSLGSGHVYAIEPVSANFRTLRQNVELNGLDSFVTLERTAFGKEAGDLVMHVEPEGSVNNAVGDNMLSETDRMTVRERAWKTETAPVARLDEWARRRGVTRCDLIKIDVEGAELLVFEGGTEFLKSCRPIIIGEFSPYWMKQIGQDFNDVMRFFTPLGYSSFREVNGRFLELTEALIAKGVEVPTYGLVPNEQLSRFDSALNS